MSKPKRVTVILMLLIVIVAISVSYGQTQIKPKQKIKPIKQVASTLKFRFSAINSKVSSIRLPKAISVKGKSITQSGQFSAVLAPPRRSRSAPLCTVNLKTGKTTVAWPVTVTAPIFDTLVNEGLSKQRSVTITFVGTAVFNFAKGDMFAVDVAHFKHDFFGDVEITNTNNFKKPPKIAIKPGAIIRGDLTSLRPGEVTQYPLTNMFKEAFQMAGITLPSNIINGFVNKSLQNPLHEIILYFHDTRTFVSADLTGSVTMEVLK